MRYKPNGCDLLITSKNTVSKSAFSPCFFIGITAVEYTGSILKII